MNYNKILLIPAILLMLNGCVDDKGNYSYADVENLLPIEISGIKDSTYMVLSEVTIDPEIKGMINEADYDFTWYTYPEIPSGILSRDTLGTSRKLIFTMRYPVKEKRVLFFEVKDKKTGYFKQAQAIIESISEFSQGWFVVKDKDGATDMDFIHPSGEIRENVLYASNQKNLEGKAIKALYQSGAYNHQIIHDDGSVETLENLKALHIMSEKDLWTVNPEDMSIYKTFDEQFYMVPEKRALNDLIIPNSWMGSDAYLMNDGRFHTIFSMMGNIGKYGYEKHGHPKLYPGFLMFNQGNSSALAFSRETYSFVYTDSWSGMMDLVLEPQPTDRIQVSATEMDADVLWMAQRDDTWMGATGWALMKNLQKEEYYLADLLGQGAQYPFAEFDTIPAGYALPHADVYGVHKLGSIYFAKGSELFYYQRTGQQQQDKDEIKIKYDFKGETITYVANIIGEVDPDVNLLAVVTNSGGKWKLYRFKLKSEGLSPEITDDAPEVSEGTGNACYVMLME